MVQQSNLPYRLCAIVAVTALVAASACMGTRSIAKTAGNLWLGARLQTYCESRTESARLAIRDEVNDALFFPGQIQIQCEGEPGV